MQQQVTAEHLSPLLSFAPIGDALWDNFATELLDKLSPDASELLDDLDYPSVLPSELLTEWEPEFGSDPRYWELCYWCAHHLQTDVMYANQRFEEGIPLDLQTWRGEAKFVEYLAEAVDRGVASPNTLELHFVEQQRSLEELRDRVDAGYLTSYDKAVLSEAGVSEPSSTWIDQQLVDLADILVDQCADESWAWYQRAMINFDQGSWDQGLSDLAQGNAAQHNRKPLPFPLSLVIDSLTHDQSLGSEVAAGMVLADTPFDEGPDYIFIKDQLKKQLARIEDGASLDELAIWQQFICRYGSMEGTSATDWLHGVAWIHIISGRLLVQNPELLTAEQRSTILNLDGRSNRVTSLLRNDMYSQFPHSEGEFADQIRQLEQDMLSAENYFSSDFPDNLEGADRLLYQMMKVEKFLKVFNMSVPENAEVRSEVEHEWKRLSEYDFLN